VTQSGNDNSATVTQNNGSHNGSATVAQAGHSNTATVLQTDTWYSNATRVPRSSQQGRAANPLLYAGTRQRNHRRATRRLPMTPATLAEVGLDMPVVI
ncbi:MAG TPA: curlin repeat-containing protein, partial [Burkholderiaceae bacterium]|nr:curlin repeat-containing protein [Burkholderiaceae bacterium]